jgi:hypothetical protein
MVLFQGIALLFETWPAQGQVSVLHDFEARLLAHDALDRFKCRIHFLKNFNGQPRPDSTQIAPFNERITDR